MGFAGVAWLAWGRAMLKSGGVSAGWAVGACLLAALLYGYSANYIKRRTAGVPALAVAAGSQLASALMLALPAAWSWPAIMPGAHAWAALLTLALACTAIAYVLFFRLIARVGAARTVTVTFLIPVFGVWWGALFLGETFTPGMMAGCAVILTGTGLTTGLIRLPGAARLLSAAGASTS